MADKHYTSFVQRNEHYPYLDFIPDLIDSVVPPYSVNTYFIDGITNDGYAFLNLPQLIDAMLRPYPFALNKPNKADKYDFKIIVPSYSQEITVRDYNQTIIVR